MDLLGGAGKSWFAKYYRYYSYVAHKRKDVQVIRPCKQTDAAYVLRPDIRVLFYDCPRGRSENGLNYELLEMIKDGEIVSPKYESTVKYFDECHIVVLMNCHPDETKLSIDRYNIITITDAMKQPAVNANILPLTQTLTQTNASASAASLTDNNELPLLQDVEFRTIDRETTNNTVESLQAVNNILSEI